MGEVLRSWGSDLMKAGSGFWRTLFACGHYFILCVGLIIRLGRRVSRKVKVGIFFLRFVLEEGRVKIGIG